MHGPAHRLALAKPPAAARRPRVVPPPRHRAQRRLRVAQSRQLAGRHARSGRARSRDPLVSRGRERLHGDPARRHASPPGDAVCGDEGAPEAGRQLRSGARRLLRLLFDLRCRRPVSPPLPPAARRRCGDPAPRRQRRGEGQALLGPRRDLTQPRSQAPRLRHRRQGLGALHHPHPRSRDRPGPPRADPRYARRDRLGQRRAHALLHSRR